MLLLTFVLDGVHAMKKHNTKRYKCILEFIDGVYILLFLASMARIFSIFAAKVHKKNDMRKRKDKKTATKNVTEVQDERLIDGTIDEKAELTLLKGDVI